MKQPMGPPAYSVTGEDKAADLALSSEDFVNKPVRTAANDAARTSARRHSKFYVWSAAVLLLFVIVGFSPTFYLRWAFNGPEFSWRGGLGGVQELSWRVRLHGLILTAWFVAFAVQAALVAARRTALHRTMGWGGAAIGFAVIISGGLATPYRMAEIAAQGLPQWPNRTTSILVWSNTTSILAFALLLATAIVLRRRPDTHKRLMLLASISIIQPAFGRIFRWPVFEASGSDILLLSMAAPFVLVGALMLYDLLSHKSLHAATVTGTAIFAGLKLGGVFLLAPSPLGPWLVRAMVAIVS